MNRRILSWLLAPFAVCVFLLASLPVRGQVGPEHSVIRITSHGGSGTVIAVGDGWSLVLSCGHCFEGADARKPIAIDVPHPVPGAPQKVGVRLIGAMDPRVADVALVRVGCRLPYYTPVAPPGHRPSGDCWSIGYDEMKLPPQKRPARIVRTDGSEIWTDTRPWHGRSGGALVEQSSGYLVGVVSGYTGPRNHAERHPGANGIYASHAAIVQFLQRHGAVAGGQPTQPQNYGIPEFRNQAPLVVPRGLKDCPT